MPIVNKTENFYYNASDEIIRRAKLLRKEMTETEVLLWKELRNFKLGLKFRRQHPVGRFIVDFYCHQAKLVIEIDGGIHQQEIQKERDENRTYELEKLGLKVIRFDNQNIKLNISEVIKEIEKTLEL